MLQAIVFVSFLWELGYQAWGPLLTIPFALLQGFIFMKTRSLTYVVTVHLLFDAVVFLCSCTRTTRGRSTGCSSSERAASVPHCSSDLIRNPFPVRGPLTRFRATTTKPSSS